LAAATNAVCDGQGGWVDVDSSGTGGSASGYQGDSTSSWSSSGASQLPAKKPGLLVLSPDEFRANAAGEGGLVDLTRISNQPTAPLLAASPPGDASGRSQTALRPTPGVDDATESAISSLPEVRLEGLRGTSQAFDVAAAPVRSSEGTTRNAGAEIGFRPATAWPMPGLPHARPESGGVPATSALPDSAPSPDDGKTTFVPAQPSPAGSRGTSEAAASDLQAGDIGLPSEVVASDDAKNLRGKAHDRVMTRVADFVHDLSAAARLNDRRVEAAVAAVALAAALPYRRFRKRHDTPI
jgi:hypothetical protein